MWMAMVLACIIAIVGFYLVDLAQKRFVPWFRSTVDIRSAVGEG
jgi:ABC-type nitrate/sulfonate/bicarbonate transport system permease component